MLDLAKPVPRAQWAYSCRR